MIIARIDWGDDSAEKDPNLLNYYVSSAAMKRLENCSKTFVVGRKGSGKSAVRTKLSDHFSSTGWNVIEASPSYNVIRNIVSDQDMSNNFGQEIVFQYAWLSYLIKSALIQVGSTTSCMGTPSLDFARQISISAGQTNLDLLEYLSNLITRIKIKAGKLGDLGLDVEKTLRTDSDIESLEYHLKEIANDGFKFVFMIDDLDLGWNNTPVANNLLLGLLTTTGYLKSISANIHIFVFIRDDVYRILLTQTQHSDKYRDIEILKWTDDDLISLLTERIRFNFMESKETPSAMPFYDVFPSTVGSSNTINWLIERTLRRPRELLQLSRSYSEINETGEPNPELLKQAELNYSSWKLDDLCTEFIYQYPQLQNIFSYWKTKFYRNKYHLKRAEIDEILFQILLNADCSEPWFLRLRDNADLLGLLDILYRIGFIGDFILGGQGGSKVFYSMNDHHDPLFEEVQIHPCFRKALGMVERIRGA